MTAPRAAYLLSDCCQANAYRSDAALTPCAPTPSSSRQTPATPNRNRERASRTSTTATPSNISGQIGRKNRKYDQSSKTTYAKYSIATTLVSAANSTTAAG